MHYARVQYKDRCDQSIRYQKRKDFRELLRIAISGLYAVNLECITLVSNTK